MAFQWDPALRAFRSGSTLVSGLCPVLQQVFFPTYVYSSQSEAAPVSVETSSRGRKRSRTVPLFVARQALAHSALPPSVIVQARPRSAKDSSSASETALNRARANGMQLDDDVTLCVDWIKAHSLPHWVFYRLHPRATAEWQATSRDTIHALVKTRAVALKLIDSILRLNEPVRALFKELERLRMTPVDSQVVCGDLRWGCATKADFVCVDEHGNRVVCENKLGYASCLVGTGSTMRAPLDDFEDAPVNQWDLQALCTQRMMERTHPRHRYLARPMVFHTRAEENGAYVTTGHVVDEDMFQRAELIDRALLRRTESAGAARLVHPPSRKRPRSTRASLDSDRSARTSSYSFRKRPRQQPASKTKFTRRGRSLTRTPASARSKPSRVARAKKKAKK